MKKFLIILFLVLTVFVGVVAQESKSENTDEVLIKINVPETDKKVKVYVSMEKHMACGVGACLVCTCKTKDGNKRTCKDGPVFDGYYVEL